MTIKCPRCSEQVSVQENHCKKCGFSIKSYIQNQKICVSLKNADKKSEQLDEAIVGKSINNSVLLEKENNNSFEDKRNSKINNRSPEDIEDNIIRFISNIKIVKDTNYNPEDDEMDSGMQTFLVEALNDTYKQKIEYNNKQIEDISIKNTEEQVEEDISIKNTEEQVKEDISIKNTEEQVKEDISIKNVEEQVEEDTSIKNTKKKIDENEGNIIKSNDLKLDEPDDDENLILEDIFPADSKELDKLDELVIEKIIEDSKMYEKFYNTINNLRQNKMNNKVIAMVTGSILFVMFVLLLLTGVVTGNEIR